MSNFTKVIGLAVIGILFFSPGKGQADLQLSLDKSVKVGKLKNGFTYYLKYSKSSQVGIQFVVKVGFNQERQDQKELAHLMEHMPFIETENFAEPKTYFDRLGIKRGVASNAHTRDASTFYWMNIPSKKKELINKAIEFYGDCSHRVVMSPANIENARSSILEEFKASGGAVGLTPFEQKIALLGDTKYKTQALLSSPDAVKKFKYSSLLEFYDKWYRPNYQAIIIVGDFDMIAVEKQVKKVFSGLRSPMTETSNIETKDTAEFKWKNGVVTLQDRLGGGPFIQLALKRIHPGLKTLGDLQHLVKVCLISSMMTHRTKDYEKSDHYRYLLVPLKYESDAGALGPRFDAVVSQCYYNSGSDSAAVSEILSEHERLRRFGFSADEFARSKEALQVNSMILADPDVQSTAAKLADHFVFGDVPLSLLAHGELLRSIISSITLEELNIEIKKWLEINNNVTLILRGLESKQSSRISERFFQMLDNIRLAEIQPYEMSRDLDKPNYKILSADSLAKIEQRLRNVAFGKIQDTITGITTLSFSSGLKVILKPLKEAGKEGSVRLISLHAKYRSDSTPLQLFLKSNAAAIVGDSRLGSLTKAQLNEVHENSNIENLVPYSYASKFGFNASFDASSFETVLQTIYLYLTDPNVDAEPMERHLNLYRSKAQVRRSPLQALYDTIASYNSQTVPKSTIGVAGLIEVNRDSVESYFRNMFSTTEGAFYVFVGDFAMNAQLSIIMGKYFGELQKKSVAKGVPEFVPNDRRADQPVVVVLKNAKGENSTVNLHVRSGFLPTTKEIQILNLIRDYLDGALNTRLREKEKGTYGVSLTLSISRVTKQITFKVSFSCSPSNVDRLIESVKEEFYKLVEMPLSDDVVASLKENRSDQVIKDMSSVDFWSQYIVEELTGLKDFSYTRGFRSIILQQAEIPGITATDIQALMGSIIEPSKVDLYILNPEL